MSDQLTDPLGGLPFWFIPIAPIGDDVLTGCVCLPSSQPSSEITHADGRIEQVPPPFDVAAGVLVFENHEDAIEYFTAFSQDPEGSSLTMGYASSFQVARMSPQQVRDNFKQTKPGGLWHVPTPVYQQWAGEVVHALVTRGIGPSTEIATERLLEFLSAQS